MQLVPRKQLPCLFCSCGIPFQEPKMRELTYPKLKNFQQLYMAERLGVPGEFRFMHNAHINLAWMVRFKISSAGILARSVDHKSKRKLLHTFPTFWMWLPGFSLLGFSLIRSGGGPCLRAAEGAQGFRRVFASLLPYTTPTHSHPGIGRMRLVVWDAMAIIHA